MEITSAKVNKKLDFLVKYWIFWLIANVIIWIVFAIIINFAKDGKLGNVSNSILKLFEKMGSTEGKAIVAGAIILTIVILGIVLFELFLLISNLRALNKFNKTLTNANANIASSVKILRVILIFLIIFSFISSSHPFVTLIGFGLKVYFWFEFKKFKKIV